VPWHWVRLPDQISEPPKHTRGDCGKLSIKWRRCNNYKLLWSGPKYAVESAHGGFHYMVDIHSVLSSVPLVSILTFRLRAEPSISPMGCSAGLNQSFCYRQFSGKLYMPECLTGTKFQTSLETRLKWRLRNNRWWNVMYMLGNSMGIFCSRGYAQYTKVLFS
jgi:hypothetical protein